VTSVGSDSGHALDLDADDAARVRTGRDLMIEADRHPWAVNRPHLEMLELVAAHVRQRPRGAVIVTGAVDVTSWCDALSAVWPDLRLTAVRVGDDEAATHVRLTTEGPYDLVIDASDTSAVDQALLFLRLFMHLDKWRSYISRRLVPLEEGVALTASAVAPEKSPTTDTPEDDADASRDALGPPAWPVDDALPNENVPPGLPWADSMWSLLSAAVDARSRDIRDTPGMIPRDRDVAGIGSCLSEVHVHSKVLRAVNSGRFAPKLRETEVDAVLEARPELGERLAVLPPVSWSPTISYETNRASDPYVQTTFRVPPMTLRRYDRPTCSRSQVVTSHNILFPESFRQNWMERMTNIYVADKGPRFGEVRRDLSDALALPGAWFHLDSEWPGHFGHLMTEQLSRMWAWDRVRRMDPDVKILMTVQHDRDPAVLAPFEIDILAAFGITPDDVHIFTGAVVPERLYTATGMFSLPRWVAPAMLDVWDRVGESLMYTAPPADHSRRIFISRRPSLKRTCHNVSEVEDMMGQRGFTVIHPEDYDVAQQVHLFRAADVVAGFAGSGLFSLALCPTPKRVITLGSDAYTARNEFLISAARGHTLTSVQSRPDVAQPRGHWTTEAFVSGFTFDFDDEGRYLEAVLDGLER